MLEPDERQSAESKSSDELRRLFVAAMRQRSDTVHIISYRGTDDAIRGMTATAVVSVSADPPTMLVCVHQAARTHEEIATAAEFTINIASADHQAIAQRLAQPGADKRLDPAEIGADASMADARSSLRCSIIAAHRHGTHTVFVGNVTDVTVGNDMSPTLQYHNGQFHEVIT